MVSGVPGIPAGITAMGGVTDMPTRRAPESEHSTTAGSSKRVSRRLLLQ